MGNLRVGRYLFSGLLALGQACLFVTIISYLPWIFPLQLIIMYLIYRISDEITHAQRRELVSWGTPAKFIWNSVAFWCKFFRESFSFLSNSACTIWCLSTWWGWDTQPLNASAICTHVSSTSKSHLRSPTNYKLKSGHPPFNSAMHGMLRLLHSSLFINF